MNMTDFEIQQLLIKKGREFEQRIRENNEGLYDILKEEAARHLIACQPGSDETQFVIDCFWAAEYVKFHMPYAMERRFRR